MNSVNSGFIARVSAFVWNEVYCILLWWKR